jgi:hypothetical protein
MAMRDVTFEEFVNSHVVKSDVSQRLKIQLSLKGKMIGYIGFDKKGWAIVSNTPAYFTRRLVAGDPNTYYKLADDDKYLSHYGEVDDWVGLTKWSGAMGWLTRAGINGSQLISCLTGQPLSIKRDTDTNLEARGDLLTLDVEIVFEKIVKLLLHIF